MDAFLNLKLKQLWEEKLPFVCFRLPNQNQLTLYFQKDPQLHSTQDLKCSGFVMAPYEAISNVPFIPDQFVETVQFKNEFSEDLDASEVVLDTREKTFFKTLVKKAKDTIAAGKLTKVVLSQTQKLTSNKSILNVFEELLNCYPLAMVYLWHHPQVGTWFGATPEQFISSQKEGSQTVALAGTQIYHQSKPPRWTKKEREEQVLVALQVEQDLRTLFPHDQIKKSETSNQRAGKLVHLCTHFQFPALNGNLFEVSQALHPTPAVGGVPKAAAQDFIQTHELHNRSFYTGFLGPITSTTTQLFVNLRCGRWTPEEVTLYVGAGITAQSDPDKEWEETLRKAKTLASVL